MHWLFEPSARRRAAVILTLVAASPNVASCYSTGDGTLPPPETFYFPVGLAVSKGDNVLYVVNSDFDLQWNGGTIQSYDLNQIRYDAALLALNGPGSPAVASIAKNYTHQPGPTSAQCPSDPPVVWNDGSGRVPLGEGCAPPVNSYVYVRDSVIIGAFATDIQLSPSGGRFYIPVRGDASLTWGDVTVDDPTIAPPQNATVRTYAPFKINCGVRVNGRCDAAHHAGVDPNEPGNTRGLVLPGEPFAMAQSADGTNLVITHQTEQETSLFLTGLDAAGNPDPLVSSPSLKFIVDQMGQGALPLGGDGITAIPHDPLAFGCAPSTSCTSPGFPGPAFLETNNTSPQANLLRYYSDDGSSLYRPYLVDEQTIPLTINQPGTDWRGVAIDTSVRLACELNHPWPDPRAEACAQTIPADLFMGSRSPPSLVLGHVGSLLQSPNASYDADAIGTYETIALQPGISRVYVAPIVNAQGNYERRVFVVAFDSNLIYVYNPQTGITDQISVGNGPFALAFDPFSLEDMALEGPVLGDPRHPDAADATNPLQLKAYRFAYVASFTNSYVQVIDLDDSRTDKSTFETVVFTLGNPTIPKGTQQND
jgi:hypothetical protein